MDVDQKEAVEEESDREESSSSSSDLEIVPTPLGTEHLEKGAEAKAVNCLLCQHCLSPLCLDTDIITERAEVWSDEVYSYQLEFLQMKDVWVYSATNPSSRRFDVARVKRSALEHGLKCEGRFSDEHSWFPRFGWNMCCCAWCGRHVGWGFAKTQRVAAAKQRIGDQPSEERRRAEVTAVLAAATGVLRRRITRVLQHRHSRSHRLGRGHIHSGEENSLTVPLLADGSGDEELVGEIIGFGTGIGIMETESETEEETGAHLMSDDAMVDDSLLEMETGSRVSHSADGRSLEEEEEEEEVVVGLSGDSAVPDEHSEMDTAPDITEATALSSAIAVTAVSDSDFGSMTGTTRAMQSGSVGDMMNAEIEFVDLADANSHQSEDAENGALDFERREEVRRTVAADIPTISSVFATESVLPPPIVLGSGGEEDGGEESESKAEDLVEFIGLILTKTAQQSLTSTLYTSAMESLSDLHHD